MARSNQPELLPIEPIRRTRGLLRHWWLRYQLECSEGELAGIEREGRTLDEERRIALRRNLWLRSVLQDTSGLNARPDLASSERVERANQPHRTAMQRAP